MQLLRPGARNVANDRSGRPSHEDARVDGPRDLELLARLGSTSGSVLHRGLFAGRTPVLVKRAEESTDPWATAARLRRECALLESLAEVALGPAPIALLEGPPAPALVLEDRPGELLAHILSRGPLAATAGLAIAGELARGLAELHARSLVHLDLGPANVLAALPQGQESARAYLVDLSRAAVLGAPSPAGPGDDLAYLSPERTGRVAHEVDCRSDLYSLGVLLYRMLTGQMPFAAADALESIHAHIARQPRRPSEIGSVPRAASDIAMKLLAKAPGDRYQSALGLLADLEACLDLCRAGRDAVAFVLGTQDVFARLEVPHEIYGREAEREVLLRTFQRVASSGAPALALVVGYSGIGKSSLVEDLRRPLALAGAYFGSGKCDRLARRTPYSPLRRALGEVVQQALARSDAETRRWRELLLDSLGSLGQLVVDLVPQLSLLLGPQSPVPPLPPVEAQQRFQRLFQRFLGALASAQHPLVLFLDDLQWVDPATLTLLEHLATRADTRHLLLIGAYRDNEVGSSHPLARMLAGQRRGGVGVEIIALEPLSIEPAKRLVADTLRCELARCEPLTRLILGKTGGNPFFFIQFLSMLHHEGLLAFDRARREWTWDLDRIEAEGYTENVAELMATKLRQLSEPAQRVLRLAGCLGNGFDLATLALLDGRSSEETEEQLAEAIERGFLRASAGGELRFLHDRVQEAASALIPEEERAHVHLRIGRLLLDQAAGGRLGDRVFDVVRHLRRGAGLLEEAEQVQLAELELEAGRRAQAATAYLSALQYFADGQTFLPADAWRSHHALSYALALERARCEWVTGDFAAAEEWIATLSAKARSRSERAEVYRARVDLLTTQGRTEECARAALEACSQLFGFEFPLHPDERALQTAVESVLEDLAGRQVEQLLDLPPVTDPDVRAALALISSSLPSAFYTDPALHDLIVCQAVRLSLRHGNSPHSAHGYVTFGIILGHRRGRWSEALRFGRLACDLVEREGYSGSKVAAYYLAGRIAIETSSPREALRLFRTALEASIDGGDANHGCYAAAAVVQCRLASGEPLADVADEVTAQLEFARSLNYGYIRDLLSVMRQLVASLRGTTRRLGSLDGPDFDDRAFEAALTNRYPLLQEAYFGYRIFAELLAGDFEAATASLAKAAPYEQDGPITYVDGARFFSALAAAGRHDEVAPGERPPLVERLLQCEARLRAQARHNPGTFGPRHALVSAEVARIEQRPLDAMRGYDEAIASARAGGYANIEAIANERAAFFYRQCKAGPAAAAYLRAAVDAYRRWGADAKVRALQGAHPDLRAEPFPHGAAAAGVQQLDFLAAAQASQAISGEIVLPRLFEAILRAAVESAGAQHASLLLVRGEEAALAARATAGGPGVEVAVLPAPAPAEDLSPAVLSYVRRTREPLLLPDAAAPGPFFGDEALQRRGARSVLCLPIVRQASLTGLLYLENNLVSGAFTSERLPVLKLLATQAAISLENGVLFRDLERENAERARAEAELTDYKEHLEDLVSRRTEELTRANESLRNLNRELERAHTRLLHSEKMASLGQLSAGVAHEINNPVAAVRSNLGMLDNHLRRVLAVLAAYGACEEALPPDRLARLNAAKEEADFEYVLGDLPALMADVDDGTQRVTRIVQALRRFSRGGESPWEAVDVRDGLDSTLHLLRHELELRAEVVCEYGETPPVECRPADLNQVFMNLLVNAAQAIRGRGTIAVRTGCAGGGVWVEIRDSGEGIAPANLSKIFDPFFTTKPVGEGTGLGLALSYGIVERHHGRIEVESRQGVGSRFLVWLPLKQPRPVHEAG